MNHGGSDAEIIPDEQREGGTPAVVVSPGFWKSSLGGAPLGSGLTLTFDTADHEFPHSRPLGI